MCFHKRDLFLEPPLTFKNILLDLKCRKNSKKKKKKLFQIEILSVPLKMLSFLRMIKWCTFECVIIYLKYSNLRSLIVKCVEKWHYFRWYFSRLLYCLTGLIKNKFCYYVFHEMYAFFFIHYLSLSPLLSLSQSKMLPLLIVL